MRALLPPLLLLVSFYAQAQVPQKINYQAVIRNSTGTVVTNQNVAIRFSLRDGSANGNVQYSERHTTTTNAFGLINLQIGAGAAISGSMDAVSWHTGNKFLQVEADITGGNNYTTLATVALISVPYAIQADNAGNFSGTLAGDVTGTQSSTVIQPNAVTEAKLADNAVTTTKIADNAVTEPKLADNAVTTTKIATNAVNTAHIADNAVTEPKLADNAVTTTKIAANAVNTTHIADNAVTEPKLADNAVTTTKIATNAVNTAHIADNAVTEPKLADNAVTTTKIAANAVNTTHIADNAVTEPKLADNAVTNTKIAANAVNTTHIADNAVTEPKLADNAVTTTKIATNAVNTAHIADNAVTEPKLADNAVTNTKIAANAVNTTHIVDNAITEPKLADNAVTNTKIADNAVNTTQIADNAITAPKIAAGQVVKSVNGIKDNLTLATTGDITLTTTGHTLTIGSTGIAGITTGLGLNSTTTNGHTTIAATVGGDGSATTLSRSDHTHIGANWNSPATNILSLNSSSAQAKTLYVTAAGTGVNAAAIVGSITSTTGQSVGVWGVTRSNDGSSAGVFGQAKSNGASKAIWGDAAGAGTYAIFGQANGAGSMAGYFQGNVTVTGNLSKGGGSFKIDHPLDPANKYLSHSFVESPDMMNVYNGNVTLDASGEATVQLPDWFEALNRDFRYQLTAIGKPSPNLYIAQEVQGNSFRIAGGAPGGKVSWMITGIRHDPYANKHRIQVEEAKPANERGAYLHPDAYGQSFRNQAAKSIRNITPPGQ